ncbi:hypothetical protein QOT17_003404 [Balamuthia mandrillaris]
MARLCSLTKTEFFCVPTQWFVVDATKDHSAVSWVKSILTSLNEDEKNGKEPIPSASSVGIDYVRVPWPSSSCSLDDSMTLEEEEDDAENESNDEDLRWKRLYADHIRPKVLAHFQTMFNLRRRTSPSSKGEPQSLSLHSSTRGRLVVWVVGELARPLSALILEELPVDLTNMVFWKTGGLKPAVVRVALVPNEHTKNSFLNQLSYQYFGEQPTNKASSISSSSASVPSSSSSSSPLRQHQQPPTYVQHNEYDCCLLVHDISRFKAVLRRLIQLHVEELHLIQELTPVPHKPGELLVMDPTKRWRKVNWFSMTQPLTFPRLWRVTSSDADETRSLLQKLDGTLSTRESIEVRRELNWNALALVAEAYRRPLDLAEDDPNHRISRCDEWTRREFIQYLQKRGMFKESLQQIEIAKQNGTGSSHLSSTASSFSESSQTSSLELTYDPSFMFTVGSSDDSKETKLPLIYLKLEGMALLQMGKEAEGKELLKIYVDTLLEEENKGTGVQLSATKLNEIASVALYNNDFTLARCYALKSIERDKYHQPAYKTLLWIAQQSADVNYVQEEALFFYFVHMLCDPQQAQQYYSQTMQRSPDNLFAMAYYSAFLAEVQGNGDEAEAVARQACEALEKRLGMESVFLVANENSGKTWEEEEEEDTLTTLHENELSREEKEEKKKEIGVPVSKEEAWVFGSFATLLYQRSPVEHREPIQRLYARALEVDPEVRSSLRSLKPSLLYLTFLLLGQSELIMANQQCKFLDANKRESGGRSLQAEDAAPKSGEGSPIPSFVGGVLLLLVVLLQRRCRTPRFAAEGESVFGCWCSFDRMGLDRTHESSRKESLKRRIPTKRLRQQSRASLADHFSRSHLQRSTHGRPSRMALMERLHSFFFLFFFLLLLLLLPLLPLLFQHQQHHDFISFK